MSKDGIEYALVARKSIILAEYAVYLCCHFSQKTSGNFKTFATRILDNIDPMKANKMTYVYDQY